MSDLSQIITNQTNDVNLYVKEVHATTNIINGDISLPNNWFSVNPDPNPQPVLVGMFGTNGTTYALGAYQKPWFSVSGDFTAQDFTAAYDGVVTFSNQFYEGQNYGTWSGNKITGLPAGFYRFCFSVMKYSASAVNESSANLSVAVQLPDGSIDYYGELNCSATGQGTGFQGIPSYCALASSVITLVPEGNQGVWLNYATDVSSETIRLTSPQLNLEMVSPFQTAK